VLVSVAHGVSPAGFLEHCNRVVLTYLLAYLRHSKLINITDKSAARSPGPPTPRYAFHVARCAGQYDYYNLSAAAELTCFRTLTVHENLHIAILSASNIERYSGSFDAIHFYATRKHYMYCVRYQQTKT